MMMINRKIDRWLTASVCRQRLNRMLLLLVLAGCCPGCVIQRPLPQTNHEDSEICTAAAELHARAAAFLLTRQNPDGSFGRGQKRQMLAAKTALGLYSLAITGSPATPANKMLTSAKQKALAWLLAHQNQDGSFGAPNERVFATIMGIKALLEISPQKHNRAVRRARAFLRTRHEYFSYIDQGSPGSDLASCKMAWAMAKIPVGHLARIYMHKVLPGIASARPGWRAETLKSLTKYQPNSKSGKEQCRLAPTKDNPLESDPAVCAALIARSAALISLSSQKGWQAPPDDARIQRLDE